MPRREAASKNVFLTVRVDARNAFQARRQLRACPTQPLEIRIVADPRHRDLTTFVIKLAQDDIAALMHHLMVRLPAAEFGAVSNSRVMGAAR
ncbi:hypothetical protein GG851_15850 [Bordetella petrii]|nr:hypothetical protein [Bordetella petrii]